MSDLDDLLNSLTETSSTQQKSQRDELDDVLNALNDMVEKKDTKKADDDLDDLLGELDSSAKKPAATPADDLDDLLSSLDTKPSPKPAVKTAPKPAPKKEDDLDDLLNDLDAKPSPKPAVVKGDDLDDLLNDLEEKPAPKPAVQAKPAAKPAPKPSDDLDELLNDLDSPAPTQKAPAKKQDDLDDLLNGLDDVPAPKQQPKPAAKPAKKEDDLDDLLNGLDDAPSKNKKDDLLDGLDDNKPAPKPQQKKADELDDLLDGIDAMPTKKAAAPASVAAVVSDPNCCAECGRPLQAQRITALGKNFHPNCFVCRNCKTPIGANPFHAIDDYPYCKQCYLERFAKICARCGKPITDQCLNALGKSYHQACFNCTRCHKPFPTPSFFQKDGDPYCEACYKEAVAVKCAGCGKPIVGSSLMALGNKYHPECFVCSVCKAPFPRGQFYNLGGKPVCAEHKNGSAGNATQNICAHCNKPIVAGNSFICAMGKKFHSNHFMCSFCVTPLSENSYKENMGKPYCFSCYGKLFG